MDSVLSQSAARDSARDNKVALSVTDALLSDIDHKSSTIVMREAVADFTGTLGAGVVGTAVWSLTSKTKYGIPFRVLATALASGTAKVGVKSAAEHLLLPSQYHQTSQSDFAWGMVDGFAGVVGCKVDQMASAATTRRLGFHYAGRSITPELATLIGEKALQSSVRDRIILSAARGTAGAFAGSLAWSAPHALYNHREKLNTVEGWTNVVGETAINTAVGTIFGGTLSVGISSLANAGEIFRYARGSMQGERGVTRVDVLHFNDTHSSLLGDRSTLPQLAGEANRLRAQSQARGRTALLFELGDNYSGNVVAGSTNVGLVETKAVMMMKPNAIIPGNHVADVAMGGVDVPAWVANLRQLESEFGRIPGIASNLEVPGFPGFIGPNGSYQTSRIVEVATKGGGKEKIGLVALVTDELAAVADGAITYKPHLQIAEETIAALNKQGVDKVIVLSHLGRSTDIELARNLKSRVAAILGAHSHDIEPIPLWVKNAHTASDIPITQAGSKAGWLGELNLAIKADGTADKYRTFGRLHEIHAGVKPDSAIKSFIESEVGGVAALRDRTYNTEISSPFFMQGVRGEEGRQTPLGTIITRALMEGTNENLPALNQQRALAGLAPLKPRDFVIKHTGDIRESVLSGPVNHLNLSNVFLNTGTAQRELNEMCAITITGEQLRRILNFSVHDLPPATAKSGGTLWRRLGRDMRAIFSDAPPPAINDFSGNFIQVEGLRYSFDRSLPPNNRIVNLEFFDRSLNRFVPVDPTRTYEALTLFHPVDKWGKYGMLTKDPVHPGFGAAENWVYGKPLSSAEARGLVNAQPVQLSQVDLLAAYLQRQGRSGAPLNPADYLPGNITDLTARPWQPPARIRFVPLATLGLESSNDKPPGR